ncbi:MAG: PASTA domain-containing protein, partial [Bacteroidales bacterium]|nr:PASTA domain-containing protein [Bacteroidales bacterium]
YFESYNFAIGESTNPGSTFKLASLIVALEDGYIDIDDTVDTRKGRITYFGKTLEDSGDKGLGKITVQRAFEVSSNVGISSLIYEHYKGREKKFVEGLYELGLNSQLDLDIQGEANPEIRFPGQPGWSGITLPWMSIGYEIRMTPLQILTLYNAIANSGIMVKPRFVKEIRFHGDLYRSFGPEIINSSLCSRSTLLKVRKMLEGVVDSGTAENLRSTNYKIAGKTGTAQIPDKRTGFVVKSNITHQASFVGYFPADDPQYSCIVVVNSPSRFVYYGNIVAGPAFREIANKIYATSLDIHDPVNKRRTRLAEMPYTKNGYMDELKEALNHLDIPYDDEGRKSKWVMASEDKKNILFQPRVIPERLVPNVVGMGLKDAIYLMEKAGLSVHVSGRGTVKSQSLAPGILVRPCYNVNIEMTIPDS